MAWLPFAVIAYLIWSISNLISKVLISRYIPSIGVYIVALGLSSLLPLLLMPAIGLVLPEPRLLLIALTAGVLYIIVLALYFKALSLEEASRVIPLWQFTPLFVLLFSGQFLYEHLTDTQLTAFILLVVGGFGVSIKQFGDTFKLSPAFFWMLLSSFLGGIYNVLIKFVYLHLPYYDGLTLIRLGAALSALSILLIPSKRGEVVEAFTSCRNSVKLVFFNSMLEFVGLAFLNFAVTLAPVALVNALAGIQAIIVLFLSGLLSLKFPHLFQESIDPKASIQKLGAIFLIAMGTALLGVGL